MSKSEKALNKLLKKPKDFKYSELLRLLNGFEYIEKQGSGSRVVFFNQKTKHSIKLHKPHPGNILKQYQIELIINELKIKNII